MIIVVMGVSGSGKTTIGKLLATRLGWRFAEGDDFHPPANVEKMRRGEGLDDADRMPWLAAIDAAMRRWSLDGEDVVLACSALKRSYRVQIDCGPDTRLVYLKASYSELYRRLKERKGHFADERLLASQFAILEEPDNALTVDATRPPDEIVEEICRELQLM
jgi:gluconokinase